MGPAEKEAIAEFIARVLVQGADPDALAGAVTDFRAPFQTLYYTFEHPMPPQVQGTERTVGARAGT